MLLTDSTILLTVASICFGALLGIAGNKLSHSIENSRWKYLFYALGIITFIYGVVLAWLMRTTILDFSRIDLYAVLLAFDSGVLMVVFTKKNLEIKNIFATNELDPIINNFTSKADKKEIKLFGGDLNFFGNSVTEIDGNKQYIHLRAQHFNRILILCESPKNGVETKIRYGKILKDMPNTELRFYNPDRADLKVRGRIIEIQGVPKLLMYNKIQSRVYRALETDTANSNGALYNNIWNLVWDLAIQPKQSELDSYKELVHH